MYNFHSYEDTDTVGTVLDDENCESNEEQSWLHQYLHNGHQDGSDDTPQTDVSYLDDALNGSETEEVGQNLEELEELGNDEVEEMTEGKVNHDEQHFESFSSPETQPNGTSKLVVLEMNSMKQVFACKDEETEIYFQIPEQAQQVSDESMSSLCISTEPLYLPTLHGDTNKHQTEAAALFLPLCLEHNKLAPSSKVAESVTSSSDEQSLLSMPTQISKFSAEQVPRHNKGDKVYFKDVSLTKSCYATEKAIPVFIDPSRASSDDDSMEYAVLPQQECQFEEHGSEIVVIDIPDNVENKLENHDDSRLTLH